MSRKRITQLLDRYRVTSGKGFKLKDYDPGDTAPDLIDHTESEALLAHSVAEIASLQARLYAQNRWGVLCVLQAMDTAGKDGTIKHVMTGVNPQGVDVTSFKAPSSTELNHDFLWRINAALPKRGSIGIFNRSHYEEVLVARVHPEILEHQHLPSERVGKNIWQQRLEDIASFERYLDRQGIVTVKIFLRISRDEQKRRLLERLQDPAKHWKFDPKDMKERAHWDEYHQAFGEAIKATATKHSPWYVVPANHKWFAHLVVGEAVIHALKKLDLEMPPIDRERASILDAARQQLEAE
jgi:PPK2 family polyphosphate:nucleotide phosphotransferase